MKTVVIWDACDAGIAFFVIDGDWSYLHGKYINMMSNTDNEEIGLDALWSKVESDKSDITQKEFPIKAVLEGAKVIVAGCLP